MSDTEVFEVDTAHGPARIHLGRCEPIDAAGSAASRPAAASTTLTSTSSAPHAPAQPAAGVATRRLLMLGHGAGGGVGAADLLLASEVALAHGFDVALVEQPYRVAGRRAPAPAAQVDAAWTTVAAALTHAHPAGVLVTGGRSFGARVACRTAAAVGASGVLCLAFPTHPPGRPDRSRQPELSAVEVPVLVVQGDKDTFGMPQGSPTTRIVTVSGDHSLKKEHAKIRVEIARWLGELIE